MTEWFERLANVPGVGYEGSPGVDRSKLAGHDAVPEVVHHVSYFDGRRHELLRWSAKDGSGTSSPAHQLAFQASGKEEATEAVLWRTRRALELPGQASDYHFAIQGCLEQLWTRRRDEPDLMAEIEHLCWLDIRLIEARPVSIDRDGETIYARILAFERLITLYEREGFLYEALDVAERAAQFDQGGDRLTNLRERIARLEAEDVIGTCAS